MYRFMYRDILQNHMLLFSDEKVSIEWSFQHENCSKVIEAFLIEQNINVIKWPSQTPDLSPIEHLWNYVRRQLESRSFTNKAELMREITKIWT
jgi:hypothetical protein